jgi:release factor glutamine methyltransferase
MENFKVGSLLQEARTQLSKTTYAGDAEVLLAKILHMSRAQLLTNLDKLVSVAQQAQFKDDVARAARGEPIAYIVGQKEFWSINLNVNQHTLIPRPETESLVELALKCLPKDAPLHLADLGTGCGAIALALASERPQWMLHATDISREALQLAERNAKNLRIKNIKFYQGSWCDALPVIKFDAIMSNPPYIAYFDKDIAEEVSNYEPHVALFADNKGLASLELISLTAPAHLKEEGLLFLEHGYQQAEAVQEILQAQGYHPLESHKDLSGKPRIVMAKISSFRRLSS